MSDRPLFSLGQLVATPGVLAKLEEAAQKPIEFVVRSCLRRLGHCGCGRSAGQ